jgi:VanZ family protein
MEWDKKFYVYLSLVVLESLALFWFSFAPSVDFVRTGVLRLGDLEHLIAYTVYGFLLSRVLRYFVKDWRVVLFSLIIGSFVGGLCEGVQYFLPYRVGDVADWFLDTLGSFIGASISSKFKTPS